MITDPSPASLRSDTHELGLRWHPQCVVCAPDNARGLGLKFATRNDGSVESCFDCSAALEGYPHQLHGGMIALLLDGAMTNCLFAHGHVGVTGELRIRYHHPVRTSRVASVRAWIDRSRPPLHVMAARLVQDGEVMASASAKFMERPRRAPQRTCGTLKREGARTFARGLLRRALGRIVPVRGVHDTEGVLCLGAIPGCLGAFAGVAPVVQRVYALAEGRVRRLFYETPRLATRSRLQLPTQRQTK